MFNKILEHFLKIKKEHIEDLYLSQFQALPFPCSHENSGRNFQNLSNPSYPCRQIFIVKFWPWGFLITIMLINFTPFHQFQDVNFANHMLAFTVYGFGTIGSIFF